MKSIEIDGAVAEWLLTRGHTSVITHFYPQWWHECDVYAITKAGYGVEVEIKTSKSDFNADCKKAEKHKTFARAIKNDGFSDPIAGVPRRFYFAVPDGLITVSDVPSYAGLLYARRYEATPWNKKGIAIAVIKSAPILGAAKKVTIEQKQKILVAYKFHYYALLQKLAKMQYNGEQKDEKQRTDGGFIKAMGGGVAR